MTTLAIDSSNNLLVGNELVTRIDKNALIQDIRTRLGMFRKEYPFDTEQGVDYIGLFSLNDRAELKNAIIAEIKKDERVDSAVINDLKFISGVLTMSIQITTREGELINV